uniref:Uncharacterized protein n=1 Tax=Lepeophtheirus salmonis TaxID=72036 RepID=A0A0K2ULZ0_LEPSM
MESPRLVFKFALNRMKPIITL